MSEPESDLLAEMLGAAPAPRPERHSAPGDTADAVRRLDAHIARQLHAILDHPDFRRLEAAWRGLHYLVHAVPPGAAVEVKVLPVPRAELVRDLAQPEAVEDSGAFRLLCDPLLGPTAVNAFSLIVADYEFGLNPTTDLPLLKALAVVGASALAPVVAGAVPATFGVDDVADLATAPNLQRHFEGPDTAALRSLREAEESRFLALALPRVLARRAYGEATSVFDALALDQEVRETVTSQHLWTSAAWALAVRAAKAFAEHGWFARIRGPEGGRVDDLPKVSRPPVGGGERYAACVEVGLGARRAEELAHFGFLPLAQSPPTHEAAFPQARSVHKPRVFHDAQATRNADAGARLDFLMCVCRFAQALTIQTVHPRSSARRSGNLQRGLEEWLAGYRSDAAATEEESAARPLAGGSVELKPIKGNPDWRALSLQLRPRHQFDDLDATMRLSVMVPAT